MKAFTESSFEIIFEIVCFVYFWVSHLKHLIYSITYFNVELETHLRVKCSVKFQKTQGD